jgi:hypothetical protein
VLDIRLIRAEPDHVKAELAKVGVEPAAVDAVLEADRRRREAIHAVETLRAESTAASKRIGALKDPAEREQAIAAQREVKGRLGSAEAAVEPAEREFERLMLELPNLPHPDVPVGPDESANTVVRTEGELPRYDFDPVPHWDLGPRLGIIDFERGVKISGSRFYVLRGMGARLQRAIITWMLDLHEGTGTRRSTRRRWCAVVPGRHRGCRFADTVPRHRGRLLVGADRRRVLGHQPLPGGDPGRRSAPDLPRRLLAVLQAREDVRGPRRPGYQARSSVRQGRDGEVRPSGDLGRGAAVARRQRRDGGPAARPRASCGTDVHRRPRLRPAMKYDIEKRAGLRRVARGQLVLELP